MERKEIFNRIVASIKSVAPECCPDFSKLTEDTSLVEDLDFDSISYLMLCSSLEEAFNAKPVEDKSIYKFVCIGDVVNYIDKKFN